MYNGIFMKNFRVFNKIVTNLYKTRLKSNNRLKFSGVDFSFSAFDNIGVGGKSAVLTI